MSLHAITSAANDLSALLEATAPKGLKHPRHSRNVAPARKRIKAVIAHYFERQRKTALAAVKPKIKRQLILHPPKSAIMESVVVRSQPGVSSPKGCDMASHGAREEIGNRASGGLENPRGIPPVGPDVTHSGYTDRREFRESSQGGKTFARALVPTSLHPLTFSASAGETSEYDSAISDLITAAAESLGGTTGADLAGEYLRKHSLTKLTGGLNQTSIERLQDSIATAWDKGGSYNDIVSAITETFDDFSETRAGLIAQTEAADAYNAGRRETALDLLYDEHAWATESGDPCPVCEDNEAAGWIDIDDDFPSGDDAPTAHPNCQCVVNFRKPSGSEDEEE